MDKKLLENWDIEDIEEVEGKTILTILSKNVDKVIVELPDDTPLLSVETIEPEEDHDEREYILVIGELFN